MTSEDQVALSADGIAIRYEIRGSGSPALVFVHGWCCDRHCWDGQVRAFAPRHTIVALDLAGHGASGRGRASWTIEAFGLDVATVLEALGPKQAVLIGHSLGGGPIVEAARRFPDRVIGVIGVETWSNLGKPRSRAAVSETQAQFRADFAGAMRNRVRDMFGPNADAALVARVAAQMGSAPPDTALAAAEEWVGYDGRLQERLRAIGVHKISIRSSPSPNDAEAQAYGIETMRMSGVGHFPMLEDPDGFNRLLAQALQTCTRTDG